MFAPSTSSPPRQRSRGDRLPDAAQRLHTSGKGAKDKGGRGGANKLPEFARMGMMKKFYSDKEWADRLAAYKRKELPSQHPKLYSKDRWEDKDSGKSNYCCFKCRKIGHTMDRCKDFQ